MLANIAFRSIALVIAVVTISTFASAMYVNVLEPYSTTLHNGNSIFLGNVGPGQTFYVTISSATANATGAINNLGWNELTVSNLPSGWVAENSALNTPNLSVEITPSSITQNGTYNFTLNAINIGNYSKLGNVTISAQINVTPNVFKLTAYPSEIQAGPGEPAEIYISINNTGVSDSPFSIAAYGLPAWNTTEDVIALHHTSENFTYQVYEDTPGIWTVNLHVESYGSPLIYKQTNVTLVVNASLLNDYHAIGQGAIAFPIIYEPAYAIMYLISLLFK